MSLLGNGRSPVVRVEHTLIAFG